MLKLNKRVISLFPNNGYFGGQIHLNTQKNSFVLPHFIIKKVSIILIV